LGLRPVNVSLQSSFQPKLHEWSLDKLILAPWYKSMYGLGTWTWEQTKKRNSFGPEAGDPDFMRVLMQANDPKRGLSFSEKELWLEVFMMAAIGKILGCVSSHHLGHC